MPTVSAQTREVVAIYARALRDRTELRISVDRQVERGRRKTLELFPGAVVLVFVDNDLSGADPTAVRPGYNDFLAAVRRGDITQVVCHEQSRLTRQPAQWEDLVITLGRAGITKVHTVQGGIVDIGGSKLIGRILAAVDAEEVERAKARIIAAHDQLRAEGRPGGPVGYGYQTIKGDDGRPAYQIDPDEADAVRRISDQVCDRHSLVSIAAKLNDGTIEAPPPRRGGRWTPTGLHSLLVRPSLAGLRSRTVRADVSTGRREHEEIVGIAKWEPVLSESRWRQTLDALAALTVTGSDGKTRVVTRLQGSRPRRWLLSTGLGRCGWCDGRLIVGKVNGQYRYRCQEKGCGRVMLGPADQVETWVHRQLVHYLASNPKLVAVIDNGDPVRDRLEEDRRQAQRDMDEADVLLGTGEVDLARWRVINTGAKRRFERAQTAIDALPVVETDVPDLDTIRDRWEQLPLVRQQQALEHYMTAVVVKPANGKRAVDVFERIAARIDIDWRQRGRSNAEGAK